MELITNDMEKMIDFIQTLEEIDTDGVEPLIHMTEGYNHWRADEVREMLPPNEALKNSPNADSSYFKLPKVLEK